MNAKLQRIVYSPLWLLLHAAALLPLKVLYVLSDVLAWAASDIIRYRRRLIEANLEAAFPEKSAAERHDIMHRFYRNFTDVFVETVKLLHISDKEMRERMVFEGCEQFDKIIKEGRSIGVYCSHFGNWEWITSITLWSINADNVEYSQVYRPLRNLWFDRFWFGLRKRFHSVSIPKNGVLRALLSLRRSGGLFITGFISDQKPSHNDGDHSIDFLNQSTPFISGTELLLRKLKAAAFYADVERTSRGHYHATIRPIADDVSTTADNAVTDAYAHMLEQTIRRQPDAWLWSHNRWRRQLH